MDTNPRRAQRSSAPGFSPISREVLPSKNVCADRRRVLMKKRNAYFQTNPNQPRLHPRKARFSKTGCNNEPDSRTPPGPASLTTAGCHWCLAHQCLRRAAEHVGCAVHTSYTARALPRIPRRVPPVAYPPVPTPCTMAAGCHWWLAHQCPRRVRWPPRHRPYTVPHRGTGKKENSQTNPFESATAKIHVPSGASCPPPAGRRRCVGAS